MESLVLSPQNIKQIKGVAELPASKSIANRVLTLNFLLKGKLETEISAGSEDIQVLKSAIENKDGNIDLKMAGTAFRFLTAACSVKEGNYILNGSHRLSQRPIAALVDALRSIGADISYQKEGQNLPLAIQGKKLQGGSLKMQQQLSSQFISALMLIAPFTSQGLRIEREGELYSDTYVDLTYNVMRDLGFDLEKEAETIIIHPSEPKITKYKVEADWSAAVYWMAFACLVKDTEILLEGLEPDSTQGDKELLNVLGNLGLTYAWKDEGLLLSHGERKRIDHFKCDCRSFPDQAQTLAFLCAALEVDFDLSGVSTLRSKETDRIAALEKELGKLGIDLHTEIDRIVSSGKMKPGSYVIETYDDHRMAMSAALLATKSEITIKDPLVVRKSYPEFWSVLRKLTSGN